MLIQNTAISHQNRIRENTADHDTERISFDKNSNITSLVRYGKQSSSTYGRIDSLTYTYNGNQLTAISDNAPTPTISESFDFRNGANTQTEYLYDAKGNNRVVVSQSGSVEQTNHYYPYGALFAESTNGDVQRFKYNCLLSDVTNGNKELDRKFGLNWYDHGARNNDAVIGRWHSMDPMAEKYYGISPYAYCGGDPVNFGDYDGMEKYALTVSGHIIGLEKDNSQKVILYRPPQKSNLMKCQIIYNM